MSKELLEGLEDGSIVRLLSMSTMDTIWSLRDSFIGKQFIMKRDEDDFPVFYFFSKEDYISGHSGPFLFVYWSKDFKIEVLTQVNIN